MGLAELAIQTHRPDLAQIPVIQAGFVLHDHWRRGHQRVAQHREVRLLQQVRSGLEQDRLRRHVADPGHFCFGCLEGAVRNIHADIVERHPAPVLHQGEAHRAGPRLAAGRFPFALVGIETQWRHGGDFVTQSRGKSHQDGGRADAAGALTLVIIEVQRPEIAEFAELFPGAAEFPLEGGPLLGVQAFGLRRLARPLDRHQHVTFGARKDLRDGHEVGAGKRVEHRAASPVCHFTLAPGRQRLTDLAVVVRPGLARPLLESLVPAVRGGRIEPGKDAGGLLRGHFRGRNREHGGEQRQGADQQGSGQVERHGAYPQG